MRLLAVLALSALILAPPVRTRRRAGAAPQQRVVKKRNFAALCRKEAFAKAQSEDLRALRQAKAAAEQPKQPEQPSRPDFTADDQAAAIIPGIPDARFWADSEKDFLAALPGDARSRGSRCRPAAATARSAPACSTAGPNPASGRNSPSSPA